MPIEKTHQGRKLMYKFVIYRLSGTVLQENTRSETEVSGKIYGGGTTGPVQGEIKSTTTRFQTIFLKEADGTEHSVELVDLLVPCREGHELTLWRLGKNLWFQAHNKTTKQLFFYDKLKKLLYPKLTYFAFAILFGIYWVDTSHTGGKYLLALFFSIVIGFALATIPCGIISWLREKAIFGAAKPEVELAQPE